jgi:hypothetical protein
VAAPSAAAVFFAFLATSVVAAMSGYVRSEAEQARVNPIRRKRVPRRVETEVREPQLIPLFLRRHNSEDMIATDQYIRCACGASELSANRK